MGLRNIRLRAKVRATNEKSKRSTRLERMREIGTGKLLANITSGSDMDRDSEEAGGIRFGAALIVFSDGFVVDEDFEASASSSGSPLDA